MHDLAGGPLAVTHVSGRSMMVKAPGAAAETERHRRRHARRSDRARRQYGRIPRVGDVNTANGAYLRPTNGGAAIQLGAGMPSDFDCERGVLCTSARSCSAFPLPAGAPRKLTIPGLARIRWARWCANDSLLIAGAALDRPPRLWRFDRTLTPVTDEGVVGQASVSGDGRSAALIAVDRLFVVDLVTATVRAIAGTYTDMVVCGWTSDGNAVLVRNKALPIQIQRLDLATARSTPIAEITPPPVGLRGVSALVASADADAYAYSYGQEAIAVVQHDR